MLSGQPSNVYVQNDVKKKHTNFCQTFNQFQTVLPQKQRQHQQNTQRQKKLGYCRDEQQAVWLVYAAL